MSTCLTEVDFEQFDNGDSTDAELERISDHISSCDACRIAYERFQNDESFLAGARSLLDDDMTIPKIPRRRKPSSGDFTIEHAPKLELSRHLPNIDGYKIVDVLGHGGMGIVYRAVQLKLNRTVALKVLPSMIGAANPAAVERFQREANAAARLHHTHIIPIYDFGESHDAYYYAMELIQGQPISVLVKQFAKKNAASASPARLADMLRNTTYESPDTGRSQPYIMPDIDESRVTMATQGFGRGRIYYRQVARWIADAAHALQYAHSQRIIHRDIKPANLILSVDGRIMVADFGLAKTEDEHSVTVTGALLGTIRYCSPEQAMAGRIPLDHRTDVYSLGATMYELLCFQPAYPGDEDKKVLAAIMTRDPVSPRKIVPHVPAELETICLKAMERAPDARYQTARAFAEDLERYTKDLPIVAKRPPFHKRAVKFVRRHRAATTAATAGVLVVVMTVVLFVQEQIQKDLRNDVHMQDARHAMNNNEYDDALIDLQAVLEESPDNWRAIGNLGIVGKEKFKRSAQGEEDFQILRDAVANCDRALVTEPDHPGLLSTKSVALYMLKKLKKAEQVCKDALDSQHPWAASNLIKIYALQRQIDEAKEVSDIAARLAADKLVELRRGVIPRDEASGQQQALGSLWRTIATIRFFLDDKEGTEEAIRFALKFDNHHPGNQLMKARILLAYGADHDDERARPYLFARNAWREASDLKYPARDPRGERMVALAILKEEDYSEAIVEAEKTINAGDIPAFGHLVASIAHAHLGARDAARAHLREADAKWPDDLRQPGQYRVNADREILWFETADELIRLRSEAENLLEIPHSGPQNR